MNEFIPFFDMTSPNDRNYLPSSVDSSSTSMIQPPIKSRRGRKRVTDPVLATELKHHRRSRANNRERTRMRLLNEAMEHLRTLLPMDPNSCYSSNDSSHQTSMAEDKLTKIETLRTASAYIRLLTDLLEDNNPSSTSNVYPYNGSDRTQTMYPQTSYVDYAPSYYPYYHSYC